jgi:signal transduction histidine kinase
MRERAMLIGAALTIISSSGEGCKVELALSLSE